MTDKLIKHALFSTMMEDNCQVTTEPDSSGNFEAYDSDGVLCAFNVCMITEVRPMFDLWLLISEGERRKNESGWGAEAGWIAQTYEREFNGVWYEATHYASEAYSSYGVRRFDSDSDMWVEIWYESYQ